MNSAIDDISLTLGVEPVSPLAPCVADGGRCGDSSAIGREPALPAYVTALRESLREWVSLLLERSHVGGLGRPATVEVSSSPLSSVAPATPVAWRQGYKPSARAGSRDQTAWSPGRQARCCS